MKKFTGKTLQDAIFQATLEFSCSQDELEYEVILSHKEGFLGMFKRDAVILARKVAQMDKNPDLVDEVHVQDRHIEQDSKSQDSYSQIQDNFFQDKSITQDVGQKIAQEVWELFSFLPYEIDKIEARIEGGECLLEIDGADCGLLIGERGYRYQSIHYLLCIWIKKEYGLTLKLEIANFLKNKERKIDEYIQENYERITSRPSFQTQEFDSLSAMIALRRFRESIPNRYIALRQVSEIESVIVISEFRTR